MFSLGLDLLRAVGRFRAEVTIETVGTVLLVATASVVAAAGGSVTVVLAVFAAHSALGGLVCHALLREQIGAPVSEPAYRRQLIGSGLALAGAAGATAVATRGPLIVLGLVASATAFAELSAGLRFADAFYVLALTAGQAMLPSLAAVLTDQPGRALRLVRRAVGLTALAGLAVAAVLAPLGEEFTRAIFGAPYASSGVLLSILAVSLPFMGMFWIAWFGLCAYDCERVVLASALACAAVALTAAVIVVPSEGAHGAAWVYSGTIALLALVSYAALERCARADRAG
jgi:O-antigen/teichoic acid export membrane protein